jgi:mannonate dehydratase
MEHTWRWFGPHDPVGLNEIRQAGARGIVTALHHIPAGEVWSIEEIMKRKNIIREHDMEWSVVESVPVHGDIKKQTGDYPRYIENFKQTIKNLGDCGISTVCYNFIPMLDWTRTDISWMSPDSTIASRFDMKAFAAFDLFILKRPGAKSSYSDIILDEAEQYFNTLDEEGTKKLTDTILLRLPGTEEKYEVGDIREMLKGYAHIDRNAMKAHLFYFLREIVPVAEQSKVKLAIHADDPPFSLFGLPRIVSTKQDALDIINAVDSEYNGLTICSGSYGAGHFNDLVEMTRELAQRIHFVHLRNVKRDTEGNFYEDHHLDGDIDLYGVIRELLLEEQRRKNSGAQNWQIPMRPDHGHKMLDDINKTFYPGYSLIGRLKALAELRGLELGAKRCL